MITVQILRRPFFILLLIVSSMIFTQRANAENQPDTDLAGVVKGNSQFAFDLYGHLRGHQGNLFFSPSSISIALAMTYGGAKGDTEKQMADVLHFDLRQPQLHQAFATLLDRLRTHAAGIQVSIANRLWGQAGYGILPAYLQLTRDQYGAELGQVDFLHHAEAARQEINSWVEQQTNGRIKDLIPPGALNSFTRLVLTNAIYFKGDWAAQFDKAATKELPFHTSAAATANVPMMFQQHEFKYGTADNLQILELPYVDNKLSMVVLLPKEVDGLRSLEAKLTQANFEKWTSALREQQVEVYLPKFKMTSEFSLKDVLQSMGMTAAFDAGKADFSGMDGKQDLYLSAVLHKAYVDVNEEGTEAAAATGLVIEATAVRVTPIFRADHPFLFFIRDHQTGSIQFLGRVVNPAANRG